MYYRKRMDLVWKALKVQSRPIYDLIDDVFPFVPENDVFLAVSEIFAHLEILINVIDDFLFPAYHLSKEKKGG